MASILTQVAARYGAIAQKRPLTTNVVLGFTIAGLGDVACQIYFERQPWNARRTMEMGVIRAVVMAPFLQLYFPFLSRLVPGTTMTQVFKRVLADQIIGSPVSISLIFAAACLVRGQPDHILPRIENQLLPTMLNGAMYWPFVHSLNFRFVPVLHQPVVAHVASLWWNAVLSYRANIKIEPAVAAAADAVAATTPALALIAAGGADASASTAPAAVHIAAADSDIRPVSVYTGGAETHTGVNAGTAAV